MSLEESSAYQTVLAVFPAGEDRAALGGIFERSHWTLRATGELAEARQALHTFSIGAVISESRFPDGQCWKDLLSLMQNMTNPPPLIVADRLADERLWAEVLNLGGHDLLAKPFEAGEVLYAVEMACRCRENGERMAALRKLPKPSEGSDMSAVKRSVTRGVRH